MNLEKHDHPDRMFIDVTGIDKTPCSVRARGLGRDLDGMLVYGSQTGGRLIIRRQQRPIGTTKGLNEVVEVPDGAEIEILTPYADPPYIFDPVQFAPGYKVELSAKAGE